MKQDKKGQLKKYWLDEISEFTKQVGIVPLFVFPSKNKILRGKIKNLVEPYLLGSMEIF